MKLLLCMLLYPKVCSSQDEDFLLKEKHRDYHRKVPCPVSGCFDVVKRGTRHLASFQKKSWKEMNSEYLKASSNNTSLSDDSEFIPSEDDETEVEQLIHTSHSSQAIYKVSKYQKLGQINHQSTSKPNSRNSMRLQNT